MDFKNINFQWKRYGAAYTLEYVTDNILPISYNEILTYIAMHIGTKSAVNIIGYSTNNIDKELQFLSSYDNPNHALRISFIYLGY